MGGVGGGGLLQRTDFQTGGLLERGGGLNREGGLIERGA